VCNPGHQNSGIFKLFSQGYDFYKTVGYVLMKKLPIEFLSKDKNLIKKYFQIVEPFYKHRNIMYYKKSKNDISYLEHQIEDQINIEVNLIDMIKELATVVNS